MRRHSALAAAALLGCSDSATEPYTTTDPAPSGLAASLQVIPSYEVPPPERPVISAAGDSVVVAARLSSSGCFDYAARAGMAGGDLVVTVVSGEPPVPRACTMQLAYSTFRTVVRPAPPGRYEVVLRERFESRWEGNQEREVGRARVVVR